MLRRTLDSDSESVLRSVVSDSASPRTVGHQASVSVTLSRQEFWSGLPSPSPGGLPNPGINPASPALAGGFSTASAAWEAVLIPSLFRISVFLSNMQGREVP